MVDTIATVSSQQEKIPLGQEYQHNEHKTSGDSKVESSEGNNNRKRGSEVNHVRDDQATDLERNMNTDTFNMIEVARDAWKRKALKLWRTILRSRDQRPTASPTVESDDLVDISQLGELSTTNRTYTGHTADLLQDQPHLPGYTKLASCVNGDDIFKNFRKFGHLHCRVLLHRQHEIAGIEEELFVLDYKDSEHCPKALESIGIDEERGSPCKRTELIEKIDQKLKDYDDLMFRIKASTSLRAPSSRTRKLFSNWVKHEQPLVVQEMGYFTRVDDVVNLSEDEESRWLDGAVEDVLTCILPTKCMQKVFLSEEQDYELEDDYIHLRSKYRIDALVRLMLALIIVGLLLGPSAVLFLVSGHKRSKLLVVLAFTLLFAGCVSIFTKAKR